MSTFIQNLEIREEENCVQVSINPRIYPLDTIMLVSYAFIDRTYILLDGDPSFEVHITLTPKEPYDLEKIRQGIHQRIAQHGILQTTITRNNEDTRTHSTKSTNGQ